MRSRPFIPRGKAARLRPAKILGEGTEEVDLGDGELEQEIRPLACRSHDLRHTAVSRMLNAGPSGEGGQDCGWSASTKVLMARRYGHFSLNELRGAVESISKGKINAGPRYLMTRKERSALTT
jgi:hypothetical protein